MEKFFRNMRGVAVAGCLMAALGGCGPETAGDPDAALARARAALDACDFKAARAAFESCAEACATNFASRLSLALLGLRVGDMEMADRRIREAVALDPASAEARLVEGQVAHYRREPERALKVLSLVTAARDLPADVRAQAWVARGVVEMTQERVDAARLSFLRATRCNFHNAAAWYHLGLLSRGAFHLPAAALSQFELACRLDPKEEHARAVVRTILPQLRDQLARRAAEKPGAETRDPGRAAQRLAEGLAAVKRKDPKGAALKFAEARKADPLSWEAAWQYAQILPQAEQAKKAGDKTRLSAAAVTDRVLAAYRDALDAKPSSRETCLAAARFALQNRRPQAACDFLSHALAHFPDSKAVLDLYVEALNKVATAEAVQRAKLYRAYRREL